jgi:hypothetical protein
MSSDKHSGGCQCGAVKFQTAGAPKFVANCHCNSCRKATGAAFSTWVGFSDKNVCWVTAPPSYYASSPGVARGFCADCGTPLTYAGEKWAGETHFLIGVFDDPTAFEPRNDVFTEEALAWVKTTTTGKL